MNKDFYSNNKSMNGRGIKYPFLFEGQAILQTTTNFLEFRGIMRKQKNQSMCAIYNK